MRLLLVHNYYKYRGGEDVYFDSLVKLLTEHGHKLHIYSKDNRSIDESLLKNLLVAKKMFYAEEEKKELAKIITNFNPDIAHFNNIYPLITPLAYKTCRDFSVPVIQTIHNYRFMCPKGILFRNGKVCELCVRKKIPVYSALYGCYHKSAGASLVFAASKIVYPQEYNEKNISAVIYTSQFTKDYYNSNNYFSKTASYIIPYFTVPDNSREQSLPQELKKPYLLFYGRLSEEKGIRELLTIYSRIKTTIPLVVIGDGPFKHIVNSYAKYRHIIPIKFIPNKDIYKYVNNALCTIVPSMWFETGPLVMIESFAAKTPVIAPNVSVFKEHIIHNKNGLLYEFNNFNSLSKLLREVVDNPKNCMPMKEFAYQYYLRTFTRKLHYNKLLKAYTSVVQDYGK